MFSSGPIIYSIILTPFLPQAYFLSNVAAPTHAHSRGLPPTSTHVLPSHTQGQTMVVPFRLPLSLTTPTPSSLNPGLDSCSVCCFRLRCLSFTLDSSQAELYTVFRARLLLSLAVCSVLKASCASPPYLVVVVGKGRMPQQVAFWESHCRLTIYGVLWLEAVY